MVNKLVKTLRRNKDFLDLKNNGKKYWASSWMMFSILNSHDNLQYGVIISRKVGNAVLRNRIKRWTRVLVREFTSDNQYFKINMSVYFKPMRSGFYDELDFDSFKKIFVKGTRFVELNYKKIEKNRI